MKKRSWPFSIIIVLYLTTNWSFAQSKSTYNFVYVNINGIERVSLQSYLSKLYDNLTGQKYIFFLSNRNRPIVATDEKSFESLQASISNINITTTDRLTDIEEINKVMSKYDFLFFNDTLQSGNKISCLYKEVVFHFIVDPNFFAEYNLDKYLIRPLMEINYLHSGDQYITVNVCFDANELKELQKKDPKAFMKNEFNLIKY